MDALAGVIGTALAEGILTRRGGEDNVCKDASRVLRTGVDKRRRASRVMLWRRTEVPIAV